MSAPPVLYSFRRCPYAIRARLALAAAALRPGVDLELREVRLSARPPELLEASPKGTVPVLLTGDGTPPSAGGVLSQSLQIMHWALQRADPQGWWAGRSASDRGRIEALIAENDGVFKRHLDRFRYPDRYPGETAAAHRLAGLAILRSWNEQLVRQGAGSARQAHQGGWLLGERPSLADMALLPFVRQFQLSDPEAFAAEPDLGALQGWLARFLASADLASVMEPPWGLRHSWRSPRWLYHLALAEDWQAARREGMYARSTRGLSLQQVGFIHASHADQLAATWRRFYADAADLRLLHIDPERLVAAGVPVRLEPAPDSGELFPHLYGALPLAAVRLAERFAPPGDAPARPAEQPS
ncbi:MAG: DUF952 domain-containing protein [Synechococcaceae cyanobacterium]|nr:DUF952 domain-containing protein [Synechococcaceae cyanobacterium]